MAAPKGNQYAKGGKGGGRKPLREEIENIKDIIKKQTIEELAEDKVYKQITILKGRDKKDRQGVKEIALPVYLKSKADKVDTNFGIKKETLNKIEEITKAILNG